MIISSKDARFFYRDPTETACENGGEWAKVAVNWLDWQLKGNADAGTWFKGENCGYCKDENWTLEYKPEG